MPYRPRPLRRRPRRAGSRGRLPEKDCCRAPAGHNRAQPVIMTRQQVLDLYFLDARCKLIELAAFLDRVDRADGSADFRLDAFRQALRPLADRQPERAKAVLAAFSDPTAEPIPAATTKAACGAWPGSKEGVAG